MDNSILIGKYIYKFLSESEYINNVTKGCIAPLKVNADVKYPFIVFSTTDLVPEYDKDGIIQNNITVQVICVSNDYYQLNELANNVRSCLELKHYKDDIIYIDKIIITGVSENTVEDAYLKTLTFNITN